jgi:hypothetical protein
LVHARNFESFFRFFEKHDLANKLKAAMSTDNAVFEQMWPSYFPDSEFQPTGNGIVEVARQYGIFFEGDEGCDLLHSVSQMCHLLIVCLTTNQG